MRKVSMNEQQFERFITENAIRVAQRYLMETADYGAEPEPFEDPYGGYDEDYPYDDAPYEDDYEDYQDPRY